MTPEEILHKHVDKESMDELSENVWPDIVDAMKEYALSVAREAVEDFKADWGSANRESIFAVEELLSRIEKLTEES